MKQLGTIYLHRDGPVTIHTYGAPLDGEMVNAHVIETANRLVVVDSQFIRPYAQEFRAYVNRLGKPIDRVIISHLHPDHWFGLEYFRDAPIHALPETQGEIAGAGDWFIQDKRQWYGEMVTSTTTVPTQTVTSDAEEIDGLQYRYHKIINAETPFALAVELPELKTLIAQDLVYNRVHLAVGDKGPDGKYLFDGWIANLQHYRSRGFETILPGHGEPTDSAVFDAAIEYVKFAKQTFESGATEQELGDKINARYPDYRVPVILEIAKVFLYHRTW